MELEKMLSEDKEKSVQLEETCNILKHQLEDSSQKISSLQALLNQTEQVFSIPDFE